MNRSFTTKQLQRRSSRILGSFQTGAARPNAELIRAVEDQPVKPTVVARLTVTRQDGKRIIVEIYDSATFSSFYHLFAQQGNRRSTKRAIRTASRNDGPGLESLARKLSIYQAQSNPVISIRVTIYRKRAYRRLLSLRPDQLGLTATHSRLTHVIWRPGRVS